MKGSQTLNCIKHIYIYIYSAEEIGTNNQPVGRHATYFGEREHDMTVADLLAQKQVCMDMNMNMNMNMNM